MLEILPMLLRTTIEILIEFLMGEYIFRVMTILSNKIKLLKLVKEWQQEQGS